MKKPERCGAGECQKGEEYSTYSVTHAPQWPQTTNVFQLQVGDVRRGNTPSSKTALERQQREDGDQNHEADKSNRCRHRRNIDQSQGFWSGELLDLPHPPPTPLMAGGKSRDDGGQRLDCTPFAEACRVHPVLRPMRRPRHAYTTNATDMATPYVNAETATTAPTLPHAIAWAITSPNLIA
jgi:hypothetical protein